MVQNLHGGKYQFSNTQYLAGNSFIGQQFAESLYASCDDDDYDYDYDSASEQDGGGAEEGGSLPKWAMQLQNATVQCNANKPILHTLLFDKQGSMESQNQKQKHQVLIKNEERSWERYYAFILPYYKEGTECSAGDDHVHVANSASSCFGITPNMGSLAPRGGASNVCDESKPYSDGALISIEYANDDIQGKNDGNEDDDDDVIEKNDEWLLVIGTEAEVWRYRLKVT